MIHTCPNSRQNIQPRQNISDILSKVCDIQLKLISQIDYRFLKLTHLAYSYIIVWVTYSGRALSLTTPRVGPDALCIMY